HTRILFTFLLLTLFLLHFFFFFFFNDTPPTEIYTLSLHDALPIFSTHSSMSFGHTITLSALFFSSVTPEDNSTYNPGRQAGRVRSEEHTSELQSQSNLVCRLLLEKKKLR